LVGRKIRDDNVKENIFSISCQELGNIQAKLMSHPPPQTKNKQVESAETN